MKFFIYVLFIGNLVPAFAQEYAEFDTDTLRLRREMDTETGEFSEYISEQEWYINGQKMYYGCPRLK